MEAVLTHPSGIEDTGAPGRVHGGALLRLCDEAAAIAAMRHARCAVVTAGVDRVEFLSPILVGELITLRSRVNQVWRTSLEVGIRVVAENVQSGEERHVLSAHFSMVAVDDNGRPAPVPPLPPDDQEGEQRREEADARRAERLDGRQGTQGAVGASRR